MKLNVKSIRKTIEDSLKDKVYDDIELDIFYSHDEEHNPFYYIHLKNYGCSTVNWGNAIKIINNSLKGNNLKYCYINISDRKSLWWIPKDQKLKYLFDYDCKYKVK